MKTFEEKFDDFTQKVRENVENARKKGTVIYKQEGIYLKSQVGAFVETFSLLDKSDEPTDKEESLASQEPEAPANFTEIAEKTASEVPEEAKSLGDAKKVIPSTTQTGDKSGKKLVKKPVVSPKPTSEELKEDVKTEKLTTKKVNATKETKV